MAKLEELLAYVAIVDGGGIAKAAASLNIAKSAVSRRLKLLEERYNTTFVDRRAGAWSITPAGQEFYDRARRILAEAQALDEDFIQSRKAISGTLSVSLPLHFGLSFLQPMVLDFITTHPDIRLNVDFDDRHVDLDSENYDLAVRISDTQARNPTAKILGRVCHGLYASPSYLGAQGSPKSAADLGDHALIHHGQGRQVEWALKDGKTTNKVMFKPSISSNNGNFLLSSVLQGHGIALLPDFLVRGALERGGVCRVLPQLTATEFSISILHSPTKLMNRRMRLFIEALSRHCAEADAGMAQRQPSPLRHPQS